MNDGFERIIVRRIPSQVIRFCIKVKLGLMRIANGLTWPSRRHTSFGEEIALT